jgi:hypothetical protein
MRIENERSDLKADIDKTGWVCLLDEYGQTITLGKYPNARFEVLEELLKKVKEKKCF